MAIRSFEGKTPKIAASAYVDESAVIIGDVEIGEDSSIWPGAVIRGDIQSIRIGARTSIQDNCVIHVTHAGPYNPKGFGVTVGDDVTVGHHAVLHGCTISDGCLIGIGSKILDGAVLEENVMLGAGSVVPPAKKLHKRCLWMGAPAKLNRNLTDSALEFLKYSAEHYVELKDRYLK